MERKYEKNVCGWEPSMNDYLLIFKDVSGFWREVSGNIPQYADMLLADYLEQVGMQVPDDCEFCRIHRYDYEGEYRWEFRQHGGMIRIFFKRWKVQ